MILGERYELLRFVGRGGFGRVFQAKDRLLGIECALKFLDPNMTEEPEQVERFKREILLGRKVRHENVCQIYDFGDIDGYKFISMEFINGQTLKERLQAVPPLSQEEGLNVSIQVCAALAVAHKQGIVHRDLKLDNVMLEASGDVKVMDFGIARAQDTAELTAVNTILGTPLYLAPERWQGAPVNARGDVYALGVLLYQIFAGSPPFSQSADMLVLCYQHISETPPAPRSLNPEISPALEQIMERCLAKDPDLRFADAGELGLALQNLRRAGLAEIHERPTERLELPAPKRRRWVGMLFIALGIAGGLAALGILKDWRDERPRQWRHKPSAPTPSPQVLPPQVMQATEPTATETPAPSPTPAATPSQTPRPTLVVSPTPTERAASPWFQPPSTPERWFPPPTP